MKISKRIEKLEKRAPKYGRPMVITWYGNEPEFRGKPQTKKEAIDLINKRDKRSQGVARDLVLSRVESEVPTLREHLMDKFDITEKDLEQKS